jgi:uncharacterized protein (TIGR03437 family)
MKKEYAFPMAAMVVLSVFLAQTGGSSRLLSSRLSQQHGQIRSHLPLRDSREGRVFDLYKERPLSFEPRLRRNEEPIEFVSRGDGYALIVTPNEAVFTRRDAFAHSTARQAGSSGAGEAVRLRLISGNPAAQAKPLGILPSRTNYFIGSRPEGWLTNVPNYEKVRFEGVYPGIDLDYYGNHRRLEYDFVVSPGADPHKIRLDVQGVEQLEINPGGDLILRSSGKQIGFHKPVVYQEEGNGRRRNIQAAFARYSGHEFGFELGAYDQNRTLIIDPTLIYATYFGGSDADPTFALAVDPNGYAYIAGATRSVDLPVTPRAFQTALGGSGAKTCSQGGVCTDAFVAKFDPAGALIYCTYLGGSNSAGNGSDEDVALGVAADPSGNAYVTGYTYSPDFPTKNPLQAALGGASDAFVAKLNATGDALIYSTYLGGASYENTFNAASSAAIAVDPAGNAYVTGSTVSTNFPVTAGAFQTKRLFGLQSVFVAKVSANGSTLAYSTYIGDAGSGLGTGIAADLAGNAYVVGIGSPSFPITAGAFHNSTTGGVFVTKLNPAGSALVYSAILGGGARVTRNGIDRSPAVAIDGSGNAYVTGAAFRNFPVTPGSVQTTFGNAVNNAAFVTKLDASGSALMYSTLLSGNGIAGGSGGEDAAGNAITVDAAGNAYVTGRTMSSNFPVVNPFQPTSSRFGNSVFVTKLSPDGSVLLFSTYLSGIGPATSGVPFPGEEGNGIAVDASGMILVAGSTTSRDFPVSNAAQATNKGSIDGFVLRLDPRAEIAGVPVVSSGGVVSSASYTAGAPLAAGMLFTLFGSALSDGSTAAASAAGAALPTSLAGTTLLVNGIAAPLLFVSPAQINAQLPFELGQLVQFGNANRVPLQVRVQKAHQDVLGPQTLVAVAFSSPGIFTLDQNGTGPGAILRNSDFSQICPPGRADCTVNRASRGEVVAIYATGLGLVNGSVANGAAAQQALQALVSPWITIGGVPATVLYAGLAVGFVGLYQIDAIIPAGAPLGDNVPLIVSTAGGTHQVTIAIGQ